MKKCIYTRKDESNATFNSAEHIFPRCIGGIKTLNKDWVSAEFNNAISKCELAFAREYLMVIMPRMILGSEGRKNNRGQAGISFLKSLNKERLTLGYIKGGYPLSIPQISICIPPFKENNVGKVHVVVTKEEEYGELLKALVNYRDRFHILKTNDSALEGKLLIGWIRGQVYVGISEQVDDSTAVDYVKKFIKQAKHIQENPPNNISMETTSHQVAYEIKSSFCLEDIMRVYGKIAFNVLTHLKGQDFALRPEFDAITNAITNGVGIDKYVRFSNNPFSKNMSKGILFDNDEHNVLICCTYNHLVASVNFYNTPFSMIVTLSDNWIESFKTCGYICDWRSCFESTLEDYIIQLVHKRNSS